MDETYKVVFAPRSVRDLEAIVKYIAAQSSPEIAARFGTQLIERALSLHSLAERGRVVPEIGSPYREIIFRTYRIVFRIVGAQVEIIRFWHAARGAPQIDSDEFGAGKDT
jgi:plasmid stabilization system protein ParE